MRGGRETDAEREGKRESAAERAVVSCVPRCCCSPRLASPCLALHQRPVWCCASMGPTISKPESSATASSTSGASGTSGSAQPAVPEQERPRVGNYEVLQKIGEGTEATVFTVRDVRDGSIKVLKALHPGRGTGRKSPGYVQSVRHAPHNAPQTARIDTHQSECVNRWLNEGQPFSLSHAYTHALDGPPLGAASRSFYPQSGTRTLSSSSSASRCRRLRLGCVRACLARVSGERESAARTCSHRPIDRL